MKCLWLVFALFIFVCLSMVCTADCIESSCDYFRPHIERPVYGNPERDRFFSQMMPMLFESGSSEEGHIYGVGTMSEMQRLFRSPSSEDELQYTRLATKIVLALPLMREGNGFQLLLRPQQDIYFTLVKRSMMRKLAKATHVTKPDGYIAIDTHVHTCYSHDSLTDPAQMLKFAAKRGLNAVAITDHDNFEGARVAMETAAQLIKKHDLPADFLVIPGEEIGSKEGHVIGIFLTKEIPPGLSAKDTIRAIHEQGGIAIAAHPLLPDSLGNLANTLPFDGVESMNAAEELHFAQRGKCHDEKRGAFYASIDKPKLGASDSHDPQTLGVCYTLLKCETTAQGIREALLSSDVVAASGMTEENLRGLVRHGLPRALSLFESITDTTWLKKMTRSDDAGFSIFPDPGVRFFWLRKFD
jgi:histidinol phosphatase-like PHP family hydrolase